MWIFDSILQSRIKDLERTIESLMGKNEILERELEFCRSERSELLEKIFNLTGVNSISKLHPARENGGEQKIQVGAKRLSWPQLRENLELSARKEYWEKKQENVDKLEKEVLGEKRNG